MGRIKLILYILLALTWTNAQASRLKEFYPRDFKSYLLSIGSGYHSVDYSIGGPGVVDVNFKNGQAGDLFVYFEHRTKSNYGFDISYSSQAGTIEINNSTLTPPQYQFIQYSMEAYSYSFYSKRRLWAFGPKVGVEYTKRPFLFGGVNRTIQVLEMEIISPYFGIFIDRQTLKWLYSFNFNYYYPAITGITNGDDIKLNGDAPLKASLEASYGFCTSFRVGIKWEATLYSNSFVYSSSLNTAQGKVSTFLSTTLLHTNFIF